MSKPIQSDLVQNIPDLVMLASTIHCSGWRISLQGSVAHPGGGEEGCVPS